MKKILIIVLFTLLVLLTSCSLFKDNEPQVQQDTIDYFSQWYTDKKDLTFKEYCQSNSEYSFAVISTEYAVVLNILCNEDGSYSGSYEVKEGNGKDRKTIESYPILEVINEEIKININGSEKIIPTSVLFFKQFESQYFQVKMAKIDSWDVPKQSMSGRYTNDAYFQHVSEGFLSLVQTKDARDSLTETLVSNDYMGLYIEDPQYKSEKRGPYTRLSSPNTDKSNSIIELSYAYGGTASDLVIVESSAYQID
ncbi:TPA: hypothetical protein ACGY2Z_002950 [Listeria monocytogenes]